MDKIPDSCYVLQVHKPNEVPVYELKPIPAVNDD